MFGIFKKKEIIDQQTSDRISCSLCKKFKETSEFYVNVSRKRGYRSKCKECEKRIKQASYLQKVKSKETKEEIMIDNAKKVPKFSNYPKPITIKIQREEPTTITECVGGNVLRKIMNHLQGFFTISVQKDGKVTITSHKDNTKIKTTIDKFYKAVNEL